MPKGTYRPHSTIAYRIRVQNKANTKTHIIWKKQQDQFDEFLIPKYIAGQEDVKDIINDLTGPLRRHSARGIAVLISKVERTMIPFLSSLVDLELNPIELGRLKNVCRRHCDDLPSAVIQFKERINWRWLHYRCDFLSLHTPLPPPPPLSQLIILFEFRTPKGLSQWLRATQKMKPCCSRVARPVDDDDCAFPTWLKESCTNLGPDCYSSPHSPHILRDVTEVCRLLIECGPGVFTSYSTRARVH